MDANIGLMTMPKQGFRIPKPTMTIFLIALIGVGSVLAISGSYYITRGDIYNGGWESQNALYEIIVNGQEFNPLGVKPAGALSWGSAYCKFDADGANSKTGVPDIVVELTSAREYIVYRGEWVRARAGQVFDTMNKKVVVDGVTYNYFWDHHIFFFEIKMLAIADIYQVLLGADGEARNTAWSETAKISVKVSFTVDPWVNKIAQSFSTDEANYTLDYATVWSGVMSVSIAAIEAGYVGHIGDIGYSPPNPGLIIADNTGKLNMWTVEGSVVDGEDTIPLEPPKDAIPGVPEKVIFEVSSELSPGWEWPWFGTPSAKAVKANYKVRADVMTSAGYLIEDGEQEDEHLDDIIIDESADTIGDWLEGVGEFWDNVFTSFGAFATSFILPIVVVIAVAVALFFIMRMMALRKGKMF